MGDWVRSMARGVAAAALVVSSGWSPGAVSAGEGGDTTPAVRFFGQIGCSPISGDVCQKFEHPSPPGATDWTKADGLSVGAPGPGRGL